MNVERIFIHSIPIPILLALKTSLGGSRTGGKQKHKATENRRKTLPPIFILHYTATVHLHFHVTTACNNDYHAAVSPQFFPLSIHTEIQTKGIEKGRQRA
ncbi:hypothetical protein SESBI_21376 [Sesbania bispinosa]|nr:hypothetical protein SESBI_21376 [Sesbania bispinosa]